MKNSAFIVNPLTREGYYLNGKKEGWHKFDSLTVKDIDPYYRDPCRIKDDIELAYPTRMLLFTTIDWFKSLSSAVLTKVHCVSSNNLCCLENTLDDFNYGRSHYATTEDVESFQVLVFYHEGYLFYASGISVNDLVGFLDASDIVPVLDELYISEFRKTDNLEKLVNRAKYDYEALFGVKQLATYTKTRSIQDDLSAKQEPRIKVKKPSSKATNMIAIALATAAHYSQSSYFNGGIPQYFDNSTRPYTGLSGKAPTYRGGKNKPSKGRVKGKRK